MIIGVVAVLVVVQPEEMVQGNQHDLVLEEMVLDKACWVLGAVEVYTVVGEDL
jgi:hypothetical protein